MGDGWQQPAVPFVQIGAFCYSGRRVYLLVETDSSFDVPLGAKHVAIAGGPDLETWAAVSDSLGSDHSVAR